MNWNQFERRLRSAPSGVHRMMPLCFSDRLEDIERELGAVPTAVREMLERFNGAELFIPGGGPLFTLFGISMAPALPALEWGPDWYIDRYTNRWRSEPSRDLDWAIAITNYGGLIVLQNDDTIREWDTQIGDWCSELTTLQNCLERLLKAGDEGTIG